MGEPSGDGSQTAPIDNPILNSPYEQPDRHFEVGPNGPTGEIKDGRRPSESFIPVAVAKKGKKGEPAGDDRLRRHRRAAGAQLADQRHPPRGRAVAGATVVRRVTPITRKLLQHWADQDRENRVLFCQREAAETAIFLAEVAGRHHGTPTAAGGSSPRTSSQRRAAAGRR